jgi:hypothetical protein
MVFAAKGLELTRAMLPGRSPAAKERNLPDAARTGMRHPLNWLYEIANRRLEVRHVIRDPARLELHQRLTSDERRDYRDDCDLVLRAVISERLQIPLVIRQRT